MPKISVIIPVYEAEKSLRKCVESILYGEEKDLEVILVDDCSRDSSWELCLQLSQESPRVKCVQNQCNSGVSFTRNKGLDIATGKYVLFVDSDDWVSSSYARKLVDAYEENPGQLICCGYTFIDYTSGLRQRRGIYDSDRIPRRHFFRLLDEVMLQQLWNKIFVLDVIRGGNISFDETISMGEDHQFVLDYIDKLDCEECVIIDCPLYSYIRWHNNSLMSRWGDISDFEKTVDRIIQMGSICGDGLAAEVQIHIDGIKQQYVYSIVRKKSLSRQEMLRNIDHVMTDGKPGRHYRYQMLYRMREDFGRFRSNIINRLRVAHGKLFTKSLDRKNKSRRRKLEPRDLSIISRDCIGGVFSHDMGLEFRSPTVNLYIPARDYMKFVRNLKHYLDAELELAWGEEYPIGTLDDIVLHFVHYETCQEARDAWERRKKRVDLSKIVVLSTDRDGFDDTVFEKWKQIPYPKLLFTARKEYVSDPDSVYFPEYEKDGCVQDLIPKRKFYKDGKLLSLINNAYGGVDCKDR